MWRRLVGEEELATICRRSFIGHAQHTSCVESQSRLDLVLKSAAIDRLALLGVEFACFVCCRAALNHEVANVAVERRPVVAFGGGIGKEVIAGLGGCRAEELDLQVTVGGMQLFPMLANTIGFHYRALTVRDIFEEAI